MAVLLDDLVKQLLRLLSIFPSFNARVTSYPRILLHSSETDNLIPIVDQLINKPLKGEIRVIILIRPAEESATATSTLVSFMFIVQSQGKVRGVTVVKSIEGNSSFIGSI